MKLFHWMMRVLHWTPDKRSPRYWYHHRKLKGLAIIGIVLFLFSQSTTADYLDEEAKTIQAVESLLQSTVIITVWQGGGSGFYISDHELITNQHVVKNAKAVLIKQHGGKQCLADVIFAKSDADLALLKTECSGKPIPLAQSVKVGQSVLSMGDPMYYEFFASKGIVGLLEEGRLLHDASIDDGSSGGPVVNLNGELVGMNRATSGATPKISIAIDVPAISYFLYEARGDYSVHSSTNTHKS